MESTTDVLPFGWFQHPNGDIWDGYGPRAKPVAYRVGRGWMIAGVRSPDELRAIADLVRA